MLNSAKGFNHKTLNLLVAMEQQSPDIAQGLYYAKALETILTTPSIFFFPKNTKTKTDVNQLRLHLQLTSDNNNNKHQYQHHQHFLREEKNMPISTSGSATCSSVHSTQFDKYAGSTIILSEPECLSSL
ncbi:S-adenosylmethionine synthetase [Diaporthe eres]|nr:S-adenosylmethionine synthetase [Diaporthe eres]